MNSVQKQHRWSNHSWLCGHAKISTIVAAGIGLAVVGFAGRYLFRRMPNLSQRMTETMKKLDSQSLANNKYYKGGFEQRMTRREASLILGVSPTANKSKVKEQFKKVMAVNHPDRGGSPYIAAKINEAKDLLEK
ncbi:TIM14 translocase, partial [Pseudoatta argentina]